MNKINIHFPHATEFFTIYSDDIKMLQLLKVYYGSLIDESDRIGNNVLNYINGIFFINNDIYQSGIKQNVNVALCNIIMYIRNHIKLEEDWFLYHGSCSVINGKTYLFIGHSGAGKTTLTTFLHYQSNVITVSEDICIVNYRELMIESIRRPFFLRPNAYDILTSYYDLNIEQSGMCNYNINEKIIVNTNSIVPNVAYKIDEVIFLNLCEKKFEKIMSNNMNILLENSYNHIDVYRGVCSAAIILKKIPTYIMNYWDLREMYDCISKDNESK